MMRKRDSQLSEDGFHWLLPHAAEYVDELIHEFRREEDHGLRCWLLELIAEARSARALDVLREQLVSGDERLRDWAIHGLQTLNTPDARRALFNAGVKKAPAQSRTRSGPS